MSDLATLAPSTSAQPGRPPEANEAGSFFLDRPIGSITWLRWEHVAWAALVIVALVLRLYDLGARGMSHDESLHTQYAYNLYFKGLYEHNPMMHGPLRYHLTALAYFLFGASDYSSRVVPALFGTALVAVMYAFRRYIGRTGALLAALLIAVSPTLLFHSRYIRDDIFIATFTVLWALFAFRYLESQRKRWIYLLVATMGLSFATMENSFITGAIFGGFFVMYALWEAIGWRILTLMIPLAPGAVAAFYLHETGRDDLALPVLGIAGIVALALLVWYFIKDREAWPRLQASRAADLCVLMGTLVLPFLSPFLHVAFGGDAAVFADTTYQGDEMISRMAMFVGACIVASAALAFVWFWLVRKGDDEGRIGLAEWAALMAIFWGIEIIFFTTFFTNARDGLASGVVGSMGYWLAQQHVKRGNQPVYYYAFIGALYEYLPIVLTACGSASVAFAFLMRRPIEVVSDRDLPDGEGVRTAHSYAIRSAFLAFMLAWVVGMWFGYTVAGERMPWLLTHIALPMCVFGGWWLGRLIRRLDWAKARISHSVWLILLAPILVVLTILLVRSLPSGGRTVEAVNGWMRTLLSLLIFGGAVALAVYWFRRAGWRVATAMVALGLFAGLFVMNVRTSFMLNYVNYDMATE